MRKKTANILGIVECFVAVTAIPAGLSFILDPSGSDIGMPDDLLEGTPFDSFLIPGIFLCIVVGVVHLTAAMFAFRKHRLTPIYGIGVGFILLIWICVQMYFIGFIHFLQPLFLIVALCEIVLGIMLQKKGKGKIAIK